MDVHGEPDEIVKDRHIAIVATISLLWAMGNRLQVPFYRETGLRILSGDVGVPWSHRPLYPFLVNRITALTQQAGLALYVQQIVILLVVTLALMLLWQWLSEMVPNPLSPFLVFILCYHIALPTHWSLHWSEFSLLFNVTGVLILWRSNELSASSVIGYGLLIFIATLAGETAYILVAWLFFLSLQRRGWMTALILTVPAGLVWLVTYMSIRYAVDSDPRPVMAWLSKIALHNWRGGIESLLIPAIFVNVIGIAAWRNRNTHWFVQSLLYAVPLYIVPIVLFGAWNEVRLLIPVWFVVVLAAFLRDDGALG